MTSSLLEFVSPAPRYLPDVFRLYERAFGIRPDPTLWDWKFGDGRGVGVLAIRGGRVVGHYGGMIRRASFDGESGQVLVPADVMVAPEERGILTRNGVMQRSAQYLFKQMLGDGRGCRLAVGFPTRRHRALGERLRLYEDGGALYELVWPVDPVDKWQIFGLSVRCLNESEVESWAKTLWSQMSADFRQHVLGVRDADWLQYRYLKHPLFNYRILGIAGGFGIYKFGMAVVREENGELECLDLLAARAHLPRMLLALRDWMRRQGFGSLRIWVNEPFVAELMTPSARIVDRDMRITVTCGEHSKAYARRWWVCGGDTDFR